MRVGVGETRTVKCDFGTIVVHGELELFAGEFIVCRPGISSCAGELIRTGDFSQPIVHLDGIFADPFLDLTRSLPHTFDAVYLVDHRLDDINQVHDTIEEQRGTGFMLLQPFPVRVSL